MKRRKIVLTAIFFIFIALTLFATQTCMPQTSQRVLRDEVAQKAEKVRTLLKVQHAEGKDVSGEVAKAKDAKLAIQRRDLVTANRLLDEILFSLNRPESFMERDTVKPAGPEDTEQTVSFPLDMDKAYVVMIDPELSQGKDIKDFDGAVKITPVTVKNGMASVTLFSQPVFIVAQKPAVPFRKPRASEDSPFGFHPAKVEGMQDPYQYAVDLGVSWHRPSYYFAMPFVQKDIGKKEYDWTRYDEEVRDSPGLNFLYNIVVAPPLSDAAGQKELTEKAQKMGISLEKYIQRNSYLPVNKKAYMDFVTACVERYDGDGKNDMPGLKKPVKYWQVGNEPHPKLDDFAEFVKITSEAIKQADPSAKVVIGGAFLQEMQNISIFDRHFLKILGDLKGKYIDIIDFHWGGDASGSYRGYRDIYAHLRNNLPQLGFSKDLPVWITEMSGYSDDPVKLSFQPWDPRPQTEKEQAADLVKKYVYALSLDIEKIFWAFGIMEGFRNNDSYFDHTGIVYDGKLSGDKGKGVKKLAYYNYKLMAGLLDGSDWERGRTVISGKENLYVFKFKQKASDNAVYVVWKDTVGK